ncbi:hypothetical protein NDU88_011447 [Pleurodeles waltl]|uniref:Integrase p58-like C-terminal domain-containing protein n=1 Tax=Pleurodeles waltl TaxID=8319 RepID=A0AAV7QYT0_PLEWA|nr:hypothetical protein NDU88_011447 [Pleurodeles waltl]
MQSSLGHSSFEMLFGRQPRTLLDMLAEQWEDTEEEVKDLLTYTRDLRENLNTVWEEAHTALLAAQQKQKQSYGTHTAVRTLAVGDKALVLLPTTDNKLLARWQGPFEVTAQINPTTYKLSMSQNGRREQIYHINLLKKWIEPTDEQTIHYVTAEIPVEKRPAERPRQREETEQEDAETEEKGSDGTREERSRPDQQTHEENLDGGQGSPETQRLQQHLSMNSNNSLALMTLEIHYAPSA